MNGIIARLPRRKTWIAGERYFIDCFLCEGIRGDTGQGSAPYDHFSEFILLTMIS